MQARLNKLSLSRGVIDRQIGLVKYPLENDEVVIAVQHAGLGGLLVDAIAITLDLFFQFRRLFGNASIYQDCDQTPATS